MLKKIIAIFLLIVFLFCGCGSESVIFSAHIDDLPKTLDPQIATFPSEKTIILNMFRGLFRKDIDGKVVADIAKDYTVSDDGLVYTFFLKEDMPYYYQSKQSKNDTYERPEYTVTADDFVFAFQRIFTASTRSPYTSMFLYIKNSNECLSGEVDIHNLGVKAIDDHTLEITLSLPDPELISKLCNTSAMPCKRDFFHYTSGSYGLNNDNLIVNGYFSMSTWNNDDGVRLYRNESEKNYVTTVRLLPSAYDDTSTAFERIDGEITDAEIIDGQFVDKNYNSDYFSNTTWCLTFNNNDEYFQNNSIRKSLSIVTHSSTEIIDSETFPLAQGIIPPNIYLFEKTYRELTGNTLANHFNEDALTLYKQGLSELSTEENPNITTLTNVTVLIPSESPYKDYFYSIIQSWQKELNAFFSVETLPLAELNKKIQYSDFDIAFAPLQSGGDDVYSYFDAFTQNSPYNVSNFSSDEFDSLLRSSLYESDLMKRVEIYEECENLLQEELPVCPIFYENSTLVTSKWLNNLVFSPFGPIYDLTHAYKK